MTVTANEENFSRRSAVSTERRFETFRRGVSYESRRFLTVVLAVLMFCHLADLAYDVASSAGLLAKLAYKRLYFRLAFFDPSAGQFVAVYTAHIHQRHFSVFVNEYRF